MSEAMKKIRYSGVKRNKRKNILVTLRLQDELFFGIARCNIKADKYNRKLGQTLALGRATDAASNQDIPASTLYIDKTGLSGKCTIDNTKFLLRYFESFR